MEAFSLWFMVFSLHGAYMFCGVGIAMHNEWVMSSDMTQPIESNTIFQSWSLELSVTCHLSAMFSFVLSVSLSWIEQNQPPTDAL